MRTRELEWEPSVASDAVDAVNDELRQMGLDSAMVRGKTVGAIDDGLFALAGHLTVLREFAANKRLALSVLWIDDVFQLLSNAREELAGYVEAKREEWEEGREERERGWKAEDAYDMAREA